MVAAQGYSPQNNKKIILKDLYFKGWCALLQVWLTQYILLKYGIGVLKAKKVQLLCKILMKNSTKLLCHLQFPEQWPFNIFFLIGIIDPGCSILMSLSLAITFCSPFQIKLLSVYAVMHPTPSPHHGVLVFKNRKNNNNNVLYLSS